MRQIYFVMVCCLYGMTVLTPMVHANPIEVSLTNILIYQDNRRIDDSINLTVKCYGSYNEYRLKAMGLPKNRSTANDPELVYSYSLSCEPDNCYREDRYNPTWGILNSSCDLEGIYKGKTFVVKNFTTNPEPECFSLRRWNFNGEVHIYVLSPKDRDYCDEKYYSDQKDCVKFLKPMKNGERPQRVYGFPNGTTFNRSLEYDQCLELTDSKQPVCYETYSRPVNTSKVIQYNPSVYCEIRFDIPSDDQMSEYPVVTPTAPFVPKSPVESLYCSILEFLGGKCE